MRDQAVAAASTATTAPVARRPGLSISRNATANITAACVLGSPPRAPCATCDGLRPAMNGRGESSAAAMSLVSIAVATAIASAISRYGPDVGRLYAASAIAAAASHGAAAVVKTASDSANGSGVKPAAMASNRARLRLCMAAQLIEAVFQRGEAFSAAARDDRSAPRSRR